MNCIVFSYALVLIFTVGCTGGFCVSSTGRQRSHVSGGFSDAANSIQTCLDILRLHRSHSGCVEQGQGDGSAAEMQAYQLTICMKLYIEVFALQSKIRFVVLENFCYHSIIAFKNVVILVSVEYMSENP